jgi:hypothetical protein
MPRLKIMIDKREQIEREFKEGIVNIFGNLIEYAFFSGRFAYGADKMNKSDIDIVIVLRNEFEHVNNKIAQEMIRKAVCKYLEIHRKYGYKPDVLFPGEYVTSKQIEDSLNGRGYHVSNGNIYLPIVDSEDYWDVHENEYRAWRSMCAFNNRKIIIGNKKLFYRNRKKAWREIIKFLLLNEEKITTKRVLNLIINGGKGYLGICSDYEPEFSKRESHIIKESLQYLENLGYVTKSSEEIYRPVRDKLNNWRKRVISRIQNNRWIGKQIINWNIVRSYVRDWLQTANYDESNRIR